MESNTISIIDLVSASLSAAYQSAKLIQQVVTAGKNTVVHNKAAPHEDIDPQTEADIGSQYLITTALTQQFPGITIVGEEDDASIQHYLNIKPAPSIDPVELTLLDHIIDRAIIPSGLQSLNIHDIIIWIDPLDATREYVLGNLQYVTTLIGITYKGYPIAGVIHAPFANHTVYGGYGIGIHSTNISLLPPSINMYESIQRHPLFSQLFLSDHNNTTTTSNDIYPLPSSDQIKVVTTRSRFTPTISSLFERLDLANNNIIRSGGAGNKGIMILTGDAYAYLYPAPGVKRWDIAALQALIEIHGGKLTSSYGDQYDFNAVSTDGYNNNRGVAMSINYSTHAHFLLDPTKDSF